VLVSLRGACASCAASDFTMKQFVEQKLQEFVVPDMVVEEVKP
ncbi:MAG: NifU family protein, partial [Proteobacteria bacterium]|nr:NifU family protein [Pseudomonadota bacterium]